MLTGTDVPIEMYGDAFLDHRAVFAKEDGNESHTKR